jgi:RNA polymerase sigma-70 factor (ECF subfamily)
MSEPVPASLPTYAAASPVGQQAYYNMLIQRIGQNQDKQSFIEVFQHFAPRVKYFLMKGGATEEQADELAQETMLSVWQQSHSFDPKQASASTWIFTIARNKRIDAFRKTSRIQLTPRDYSDQTHLKDEQTPAPDDALDRVQEESAVADILETLPADQLDLIRKSFFEEKSHADIARELHLPLGTVKSRIRLALERLRKSDTVRRLW